MCANGSAAKQGTEAPIGVIWVSYHFFTFNALFQCIKTMNFIPFLHDIVTILRHIQSHQFNNQFIFSCDQASVKFQGHTGQKIADFELNWGFQDYNFSFDSLMAMKWCIKLQVTQKRCHIFLQAHLSSFKVTQDNKSPILTRIERFWTVILVWIHWWLQNDAQSLKQHKRGALLFFKTKKLPILTQIEFSAL